MAKTYLPIIAMAIFMTSSAWASIPATPVMTLYKFNGSLNMPYYEIESFRQQGTAV